MRSSIAITPKIAEKITDPITGESKSKIVTLHLRFSNLCNMKCVHCAPHSSTLWYEDWDDLLRATKTSGKNVSNYFGTEQFQSKAEAFNRERFLKSLWGAREKKKILQVYLHKKQG